MQRERITITIDANLLPAIDGLIDHDSIRNRSHALEYAVRKGLSLSDITHAFFIYSGKTVSLENLESLARLCQGLDITSSVVIAESELFPDATLWHTAFQQHFATPPASTMLPGDFGSGGALLLQKETISPSFLIVDLAELQALPLTLMPAYVFHRQQDALLTHIVSSDGTTFTPSGISIGNSTLLSTIPAGKADLKQDVFPLLVKAGKVSAYVYTP
jgi:hypothetical protein